MVLHVPKQYYMKLLQCGLKDQMLLLSLVQKLLRSIRKIICRRQLTLMSVCHVKNLFLVLDPSPI